MEKEIKKTEKAIAPLPVKAKAEKEEKKTGRAKKADALVKAKDKAPTTKKADETKKTATKKATSPTKTSDKLTTAKKKTSSKVKKTPFCKNAKYCGDFLVDDFVVYQDKVKDAFVLTSGGFGQAVFDGIAYELFITKAYIDAKGYRKWLQAAFPKSSITEERVEEVSMGGFIQSGYKGRPLLTDKGDYRYATVKVTVDFGDNTAPSSAVGYALITSGNPNSPESSYGTDPYNFISFARASALARILEAKGFGDGLDWESLRANLQPYICIQEGESYRFVKYDGPVTDSSTKKIAKKGAVTANEFFGSIVLRKDERIFSLDDMSIKFKEDKEQLPPSTESSETENDSDIQRLINAHNEAVSKS